MAVSHFRRAKSFSVLTLPSIRSRTIRNPTSARISVPSLLREGQLSRSSATEDPSWTWRTDLAATEPFWEHWFVGLSKKFLGAKGGKLLLLAGTDRLDKELMIGQMQGIDISPRPVLCKGNSNCKQANINFKCSPKLAISFMRTKPRRLLWL